MTEIIMAPKAAPSKSVPYVFAVASPLPLFLVISLYMDPTIIEGIKVERIINIDAKRVGIMSMKPQNSPNNKKYETKIFVFSFMLLLVIKFTLTPEPIANPVITLAIINPVNLYIIPVMVCINKIMVISNPAKIKELT